MLFKIIAIGILSLLIIILNVNADTSGNYTDLIDDRIVGGVVQSIKKRRFQVAVLPAGYICGGSLVRMNFVVTAGHCTAGVAAKDVKVRAGSNYYYKGGYVRGAQKIFNRGDFNSNTLANDIAVIKVKRAFPKNQRVVALQMATAMPKVGSLVKISGYGTVSSGGNIAKSLRSAWIKIIGNRKCRAAYGNGFKRTMFCAGLKNGGKDSCQGDSGGPLTYQGKLVGVVSWGYDCATKAYPGIYTRVPLFRKWVFKQFKK